METNGSGPQPHIEKQSTNTQDSAELIQEEPAQDANSTPHLFLWFVPLAPHVHPLRFFFFLFSVFSSMAVIVYFSAAQTWVISAILGISDGEGDMTGSLATYSEVVAVVGVVVWGVLSDSIQKRTVIALSLVIMGVCVITYPYAPNVYPTLLILRLIYSAGSAGTTVMMAAMMTEVIHGKGGLVSGLVGICSGLGALFAAFVLFSVPAHLEHLSTTPNGSIYMGYGIIGGITTFLGLALWQLMPRRVYNHKKSLAGSRSRVDFLSRLRDGITAAKDPGIALGFLSSFFARADEVIVSNFISLWINQYYIDRGECQVGHSCYRAMSASGTVTGIAQAIALVATPFFAAGSEYLPKEIPIVVAGLVGAVGCIPFAFSIDPTSSASKAFVVLLAIGEYGRLLIIVCPFPAHFAKRNLF